jgi:hypothetical protein
MVTRAAFGPRLARVVAARVVATREAASTVSASSTLHDLTALSVWRSTKSFSGPSWVSRPPAQPRSANATPRTALDQQKHVNRDV